jgi:iron complex transport system permease protein
MPSRRRALTVLALLFALVVASFVVALAAGSIPVTTHDLFTALFGEMLSEKSAGMDETSLAIEVIRGLRLPRALGAFACGGLLALAGALMQVLLRNPLADPYVLGISGGRALWARSWRCSPGWRSGSSTLAAFIGAFAAMLIVFGLAHGDSSWTRTRLLLTGVIVAAGCGAAVALMLSIAPEAQLRGMLFWLMGDAGTNQRTAPGAGGAGGRIGAGATLCPRTQPARTGRCACTNVGRLSQSRQARSVFSRSAGHCHRCHHGGQHWFHRSHRATSDAPGGS